MAKRDRERDPQAFGDLLRVFVAGRGWSERMALGRLREEWAGIVGESVAARCEPTRLQRGVLTVRAEGGTWATELTLLAGSIAGKADDVLGVGSVREVKVVAGPSARA